MTEQTQDSINLEIPSRWRRFFAYFLDLVINITIIWLITNIIVIFVAKTTLWNMLVKIKALDTKDQDINIWKACLRYLVFYSNSIFFIILYYIYKILSLIFWVYFWTTEVLQDYDNLFIILIFRVFIIVFTISVIVNIIELFFKCPTFIDKRLWIKRFYKKSK